MKINQKVLVNAHTRIKKYYENLGYKEENGFFCVSVEDLPIHSGVIEKRICDCCNKEFERRHEHHEVTFQRFGMDLCGECVSNNKAIRKEIQNKKEAAWDNKYGCHPMNVEAIKDKVKQSYQEKYGGHPMHNKEIKEKWLDTVNTIYGGNSPMCNKEVREKSETTLCKNGNIPTSSQQLEVFNLLSNLYNDVYLNYQESSLALDIMINLNGQKIDVEYDGLYWHQDEQKDRRRDEYLKSLGYKILRIKAKHKVPTIEQLKQGIEYLNNHSYSQLDLE